VAMAIPDPDPDGKNGRYRATCRRRGHCQVPPNGIFDGPVDPEPGLVTVAPVDPARLEVGDIVLARVAGTVYLHRVSALDQAKHRVQISNNRGRINGWTGHDRVFGICLAVEGVERPGALAKVQQHEPGFERQ
jgi:hypothetical protein